MKKIFIAILAPILLIGLFCACERAEDDKYGYIEGESIQITLPGNKAVDLPYTLNSRVYESEYASFYADDYLSNKQLNRATKITLDILNEIKPNHKVTVYLSKYLGTSLAYDENSMYLSELDSGSFDHIVNTITVALSGKVPYGIVYGMAKRINDKFDYRLKFEKADDRAAAKYLQAEPTRLDFQATDFYIDTAADMKNACVAALSFCDFIEKSEDLFSFARTLQFDDEKLDRYKADFAASLNMDLDIDFDSATLPVFMSIIDGKAKEFLVRGEYFDMSIPVGFVDEMCSYPDRPVPGFYDYKATYKELIPYLAPIFTDITECEEFLRQINLPVREKPIIRFSWTYQTGADNECFTSSVRSLFSIYVFYRYGIITGQPNNHFAIFATNYLSYKFGESEKFVQDKAEKLLNEELDPTVIDIMKEKFPEYADYHDCEMYDFVKYWSYVRSYQSMNSDIKYDPYDYLYGSTLDMSFVFYIAEEYGFVSIERLRLGESYFDVFGKEISEVKSDFISYIKSLFVEE